LKAVLLAIQFLTRIPVKIAGEVSARDLARSAAYFPFVGLLHGIPASCCALIFSLLFTPEIAAGIVVLTLILINGGFHLDGLADTADAISVKSTGDSAKDRETRLAVMKDSRTGAIGVVAIVLDILLKYLFIAGLLGKGKTWDIFLLILLIPVFSKWVIVPAIYHGKAARDDGLGKAFIDEMDLSTLLKSFCILAIIFAAFGFVLPDRIWPNMVALFFLLALPMYGLSLLWVRFCTWQFGGLTGDNMGAISEVGELLCLSIGFLWL
jgi:adenosylcobinamide-GDP ribazoletransferase